MFRKRIKMDVSFGLVVCSFCAGFAFVAGMGVAAYFFTPRISKSTIDAAVKVATIVSKKLLDKDTIVSLDEELRDLDLEHEE